MKIKFKRDFKPFKKGQELEIKTTAEKKYADYYINNQIAHEVVCDCEDDEQECKRGVILCTKLWPMPYHHGWT
jgi:hypothetical protein